MIFFRDLIHHRPPFKAGDIRMHVKRSLIALQLRYVEVFVLRLDTLTATVFSRQINGSWLEAPIESHNKPRHLHSGCRKSR